MRNLPSELYFVEKVIQLEQLTIRESGISGYTLMRRAGQSVFDIIRKKFPYATNLLILCGAGNNAGDGYVVARLASQAGYTVTVVSMVDGGTLHGEAHQAYLDWCECGAVQEFSPQLLEQTELVVDALLGTGLKRDVSNKWADLINAVNSSNRPVLAVDIPSGLKPDTGAVAGVAIQAEATVSFIGLKAGLFTGMGPTCGGRIYFHNLGVPEDVFQHVSADVHLLNNREPPLLPPRQKHVHKGNCGHVLVVGGNTNMSGAAALAAKAALRSGAGLVSVFTRPEHQAIINISCPEVMVSSGDGQIDASLLDRATHIAIGPGLGADSWARQCLQQCIQSGKQLVVDADALNLIAEDKLCLLTGGVLTPHPGEAARLLNTDTTSINLDRFAAIKQLYLNYASATDSTVILKGSGSLVFNGSKLSVCPYGNPAMATAGMGDVLTGVIAALMAQGLSNQAAAEMAVVAHAMAGDLAAMGRSRGILASDVIEALPSIL